MNIYISGISGTGMGALALMAKKSGHHVCGSDLTKGAIHDELIENGIEVYIGPQDGKFLQHKIVTDHIDWFAHTSALPKDSPELTIASSTKGIKVSKRDELTAFLINSNHLKMVAVAGTHGKTTTTAMIVWLAKKLGLPSAHIVGTTLGFTSSGDYHAGDKFFIYEADEYDRNFLTFHPWLSVITCVTYDHPDIYKTKSDYESAFQQFISQSEIVIDGRNHHFDHTADIQLAGKARREDASLAISAISLMSPDTPEQDLIKLIEQFPGIGRRFERIADGIYSDYAHHPEEITATIDVAMDEARLKNKKGVIVVYEPHQNIRQHEVKDGYKTAFEGAEKIYWLPTYLTREDPNLPILTPQNFINSLTNQAIAEPAEPNDTLVTKLQQHLQEGDLVVLMTAGPADAWLRENFTDHES